MTKKKKRRRSRPGGMPSPEPVAAPVSEEPVRGNGQVERRPRGLFGGGAGVPSPYPPVLTSMGTGLRAAGASLPVVLLTFVAPFVLWVAGLAIGSTLSPKTMANLMAIPPMNAGVVPQLFPDVMIAFGGEVTSPITGLAITLGLTFARMLLVGALIALMAPALGWEHERPLRAWARAIPHLLLVGLAMFGLAAAVPLLLQGLGQIAGFLQLGGPLIGLYLLGFAPIAAVVDGDPYREAVRRSVRAARLPGGGHLTFVLLYFALVFFLFAGVPQPAAPPATPSIATWGATLLGSLFHVGVLGAMTFRFLAVHEDLREAAPRRR